jgi:hypothetical protein
MAVIHLQGFLLRIGKKYVSDWRKKVEERQLKEQKKNTAQILEKQKKEKENNNTFSITIDTEGGSGSA